MHEQGKLGKKLNIILGFKPSLYNLNKHMKDAFTLKTCFTIKKNTEYK